MKWLTSSFVALSLATYAAPSWGADDRGSDESTKQSERHRDHRDRDRLGWYVPDYVRLQTAGYLGTFGIGVGYAAFNDVLNVSALYGFTPAVVAGTNVHAAKLAIDARPFHINWGRWQAVPGYAGASLFHVFGSKYFTILPERFARLEDNYYPPTSLHWGAQLGFEVDYAPGRGVIERHGFYYEAVTFDTYVTSYFENPKTLRLTEVLSSSLGYRCAF